MHFDLSNYISNTADVILSLKKEEVKIKKIASEILKTRNKGNKIMLAGNGGSCGDIDHFGGELICTFSKRNRKPISTHLLTNHSSAMTAWGNDFDFKTYFERQIEANGKSGDVFIGISTSGNSSNIIEALKEAKNKGITTVGLTGKDGGVMKEECSICICVPSSETPRIQEAHLVVEHIICYLVEEALFNNR